MPSPRRNDILDVATGLFAEHGYDGASMNDVAERVGMGKASLFYHFASKDALYEAVLDDVVAGLSEPLVAIYASEGSFEQRLDALTETLTRAFGANPHAARLLVRESMDRGPSTRGALGTRLVMVLEGAARWISAGQAAGAFAEGDARHLVLTVLGMHVLPFAIGPVVERFLGVDPFEPAFIDARAAELSRHARRLHTKPISG